MESAAGIRAFDGAADLTGVMGATMESKSLDDLLNGEMEENETSLDDELGASGNVTTTMDIPRDEHGRFAPKTGVDEQPETAAETVPPTEGLPKDVYEPLRAVRDENKALKQQLEALQRQVQAPPAAPPPSIWEDEQGYAQHLREQTLRQADTLSRINASEMAARSQFSDFQEKYDLFNQMAQQNPALVQQAMTDPHPWAAAYKIAQNYQTMNELAAVNVDDLKAKIREQVMSEMQAQMPAQGRHVIPPTLTTERNVGSRSGPAWSGPTPLSQLLG